VSGTEFAGKVIEVGKDVTEFKPGDRVFGFNDTRFGGHAQYKTEPSNGPITKIPEGFSYQQVAPAGEGATYALNDIKAVRLKKGQSVLIYGATGSIGSAALQICKHFGVSVTAVCGTKNVKLVKSLGADKVIDYQKEDFTRRGGQYDFILDAVGKVSYKSIKHMLKPGGKFASTGGRVFFTAVGHKIIGKKTRRAIFPIPKINKENIEFIARLLESGEFKPVIDKIYPLEKAVEAAQYAETGQKVGNLVLVVRNTPLTSSSLEAV
jgi:NADPH:quinone reductase-like Zn-dependent oxidoreductase